MFYYLIAIALYCAAAPVESVEEKNLMESEIKHVVVLMLENRSFDNVLAWLYENDHAPFNIIPDKSVHQFLGLTDDALESYANPLRKANGEIAYSCAPIKGIPSTASGMLYNSPQFDPHESFPDVMKQMYSTTDAKYPDMKGFLQNYASFWDEEDWETEKSDICAVMETYTVWELPIMHGLARHYAVSDYWFSSVPTQTNPNRAFALCGTSEGEVVNGPLGKNLFHADTLWNRLLAKASHTTWAVYWHADMLPGVYPGPYSGVNTFANIAQLPNYGLHFDKMDYFHEQARSGKLPDISFIEPQWTISENFNSRDLGVLRRKIWGSLDLLVGLQGNDMHPPGDVRPAENLIANIYASLIENEEAWNQTLFVITFDEHGGLFDHIVPPKATPPDSYNQNNFNFDRYGVRVPALFISPRIKPRTLVRSSDPEVPFDHTSLLSTLLKWLNVNKADWKLGKRVDAAPTFDTVVELDEPRTDGILTLNGAQPIFAPENVVKINEPFYLRDRYGEYAAVTNLKYKHLALIGKPENKTVLSFVGDEGSIRHGSSVIIQSHDPLLGSENILENAMESSVCGYGYNLHVPRQWWTIKSVDKPYLGHPIQYGERVYLENNSFFNFIECVPVRLAKRDTIGGSILVTRSIADEVAVQEVWTLERAPK